MDPKPFRAMIYFTQTLEVGPGSCACVVACDRCASGWASPLIENNRRPRERIIIAFLVVMGKFFVAHFWFSSFLLC